METVHFTFMQEKKESEQCILLELNVYSNNGKS